MAIKKLQNNFTTPEQSKRLIELGVPMWTADIMFDVNRRRYELIETEDESWAETQRTLFYNGGAIPHWSVGRLVEIFLLCTPYKDIALNKSNLVEQMVVSLFMVNRDGLLDFSKLEE